MMKIVPIFGNATSQRLPVRFLKTAGRREVAAPPLHRGAMAPQQLPDAGPLPLGFDWQAVKDYYPDMYINVTSRSFAESVYLQKRSTGRRLCKRLRVIIRYSGALHYASHAHRLL